MTICQLRLKVHHMVVCYPSQLLLLLLTVVIQDSLRNLASLHRVNGREKYLTLGVPCVCVCVCTHSVQQWYSINFIEGALSY